MLGGAKEAKIDAHTEDIAKYAVTELNGKANFPIQGTLKLGKIVSAKTQVRSGCWDALEACGSDTATATDTDTVPHCMHAGCGWHQPHPPP